jgi:hypothetical protein
LAIAVLTAPGVLIDAVPSALLASHPPPGLRVAPEPVGAAACRLPAASCDSARVHGDSSARPHHPGAGRAPCHVGPRQTTGASPKGRPASTGQDRCGRGGSPLRFEKSLLGRIPSRGSPPTLVPMLQGPSGRAVSWPTTEAESFMLPVWNPGARVRPIRNGRLTGPPDRSRVQAGINERTVAARFAADSAHRWNVSTPCPGRRSGWTASARRDTARQTCR